MDRRVVASSARAELFDVIRGVRLRWRMKLALRGAAFAAAVTLAALAAAAAVFDRLDPTAPATLALRLALAAAVLVAIIVFILRPLRRRVSDERVALYLEEHEPAFDAALVSAVEAAAAADGPRPASPALQRRTVEAALERCHALDHGRSIERPALRRHAAVLAAVLLAGAVAALFGPAGLRNAAGRLLFPSRGAAAEPVRRLEVQPGDTTVARGADQIITARLHGFGAEGVELFMRAAPDTTFERAPMAAAEEPGRYGFLLFDLERDTEYFVEADGIRSPVHRITVAELPYVDRIDLEYHFPAYTGLPPRTVPDGGDIAAIEGTVVRLRVTPTMPVAGGRIIPDGGQPLPLASADSGALAGELRVTRDGFYHIEFDAGAGQPVNGSPQYIIDALDDAPPAVSFAEPGRDIIATPIEEVFLEAEATDDYGVAELQLVYSVNGGPEQTVPLFGDGESLKEVSAGHTLFLEELELVPGDFIAYHARATDNDAVGGPKRTTSDIYFLEIRPFEREYRQADQAPGGAGGGRASDGLSARQRRIIAATFNVARDSARYTAEALNEHMVTLRLSQERLAEEVRALERQMLMRGVTADSSFDLIAELLPRAAEAMDEAVARLRDARPGAALPPEQQALAHLLRAESVFREVQVSFGAQGAGGSPSSAEELADLFELQMDELRNQYETVQRGERDSASQQIDETVERLKELARRQQQESERLRRRAADPNGRAAAAGGGGGQSQRELADQVEEAARRLERLSLDESRPELMESARRLREAADAMRRAAANGAAGVADANTARERLEQARRLLERSRDASAERAAQDALRRAESLAAEQQEIGRAMEQLGETPLGAEREAAARRLIERKDRQADEVAALERDLRRIAADARGEQNEAARRLQQAADALREAQTEAKIRYSQRFTTPGVPPGYIRELEAEIGNDLEQLRGQVADAAEAFEPATDDPAAETLERARDLARGVESLSQRLGRAAEAAESGQAGQAAERADAQAGARSDPGQTTRETRGDAAGARPGERATSGGAQGGQRPAGTPGRPAGGRRADGAADGGRDAPGALGPGPVRQLRRELRERIEDAEALRDRLERAGRDTDDLDGVIRNLEALDDPDVYDDPAEVERLRAAAADGIKRFEYALRLELAGADRAKLFLSGADEAPEGFREMIEAYYRALAEGRTPR